MSAKTAGFSSGGKLGVGVAGLGLNVGVEPELLLVVD